MLRAREDVVQIALGVAQKCCYYRGRLPSISRTSLRSRGPHMANDTNFSHAKSVLRKAGWLPPFPDKGAWNFSTFVSPFRPSDSEDVENNTELEIFSAVAR